MKPQLLLSALLVAALGLSACADGATIESIGQQNSPPPPTNQPDETIVAGPESTEGGNGGNGGNSDTEHGETATEPTPDRSDRLGGGEPIPEPTTFLLLGSGLAAAAYYRRRKNGLADLEESSEE